MYNFSKCVFVTHGATVWKTLSDAFLFQEMMIIMFTCQSQEYKICTFTMYKLCICKWQSFSIFSISKFNWKCKLQIIVIEIKIFKNIFTASYVRNHLVEITTADTFFASVYTIPTSTQIFFSHYDNREQKFSSRNTLLVISMWFSGQYKAKARVDIVPFFPQLESLKQKS